MSVSFACSFVVVLWATEYAVCINKMSSHRAQRMFMHRTAPLFFAAMALATFSMLFFLGAFALVGYVKSISDYKNYAPIMSYGGVSGVEI